MKLSHANARTRRLRAAVPIGLAIALTLGAVGAGYVAGKAHISGRPAVALADGLDHLVTHATAAQMEGLLLLLLGRGGVL